MTATSKMSINLFSQLIEKFSYIGKYESPLTNFTFFVGAGFGKSWDSSFPTGRKLFSFKIKDMRRFSENLEDFLIAEERESDLINFPTFKDMIYELNMQRKYSALRTRYLDEFNLNTLLNLLKALVQINFEKHAKLNYFDAEKEKFIIPDDLSAEQRNILDFFNFLSDQQSGHRGIPDGIRMNFVTTNYDYLIEAILDNIIGFDDSIFLYAYRGITPNRICGKENIKSIHGHWLVTNVFKINGGFEILKAKDEYNFDYRKREHDDIIRNPPIIMLPSREQDYMEDYFKAIFPKAIRLLQESKVLVILGYSLPEEDALIRYLLRQFAENPKDAEGKFIFYVDPIPVDRQEDKLKNTFPYFRVHGGNLIPYSGDFAGWAKGVMKQIKKSSKFKRHFMKAAK